MKLFVIVAVLCVIVSVQALTDEQKAKVKENSEKCIAETGVSPDAVEKGRKGEFNGEPKLKEFILCFLKASEVLDSNADPQVDQIKQKLANDATPQEIDGLLAKCKSSASTPVDKAAEFWKCYWANSPKHIQLV